MIFFLQCVSEFCRISKYISIARKTGPENLPEHVNPRSHGFPAGTVYLYLL